MRRINVSGISNDTRFGRFVRLPLRFMPSGMRVPILQGKLRGNQWIVGSSTHGCWLGTYELKKQIAFESLVSQGDVVYDVGANVGFYTLLASVLVGPSGCVVAFEPFNANLHYLRRHLELNSAENVQVVSAAVTATGGDVTFEPGSNRTTGRVSRSGRLQVRGMSLDSGCRGGRFPPPSVIKIDVEGGEADVLRGAKDILKAHRPVIFLATHGFESHETCCAILRTLDYEISSLEQKRVEESSELIAISDE